MKSEKMKHSGNILFLILIAVALFAALSYAITSSSRSDGGGITKYKANLAAAEFVQYAAQIEQAVSRLLSIAGCKENQLSFERTPFDGSDTLYLNPNSPSDLRCHIFHSNGGAIPYKNFSDDFFDSAFSSERDFADLLFSGRPCVKYVGSMNHPNCQSNLDGSDDELVFFIVGLKEEICLAINKKFGNNTIPVNGQNFPLGAENNSTYFKGTYGGTSGFSALLQGNGIDGRRSGCIKTRPTATFPAPGTHIFYHVLLVR
jgi:hypothetical protein